MIEALKKYWFLIPPVLLIGATALPVGAPKTNPKDLAYSKAVWSWMFSARLSPTLVMPEKPKLGKCETCKGTGRVGDTITMVDCQLCGGDGRVDPRDIGEEDEDEDGDEPQEEVETTHDEPQEEVETTHAESAQDCVDDSCYAPTYTPTYRRGLFGRWRMR